MLLTLKQEKKYKEKYIKKYQETYTSLELLKKQKQKQ